MARIESALVDECWVKYSCIVEEAHIRMKASHLQPITIRPHRECMVHVGCTAALEDAQGTEGTLGRGRPLL